MNTDDSRSADEFAARVCRILDAEPFPAGVAERLATARRQAIAEAVAGRPAVQRAPPRRWVPVGALAATLLAVVMLRQGAEVPALPLDDDVQLAAVADLELLENLEFAAWMVEADVLDAS
jgi:negative regulator of sigma E activity